MSDTSDTEKALLMALEIEKLGRENRLPYLFIVHCPDTGQWVPASSSLKKNEEGIKAFAQVTNDYLCKLVTTEENPR